MSWEQAIKDTFRLILQIEQGEEMICNHCNKPEPFEHAKCKGENWCDCQHNPPGYLQKQTIAIPAIESEEQVWTGE